MRVRSAHSSAARNRSSEEYNAAIEEVSNDSATRDMLAKQKQGLFAKVAEMKAMKTSA